MNTHDVDPSTALAERYGDPRRGRMIAVVLAVVVVGAFLVWLAWATWFHVTPEVTSEMTGSEVVDAHTATVVVQVDIRDSAEDVNCRVEARATDHAVVGVLDFEPVDGRNEVTIVTEREATAVEWVGCTADGQSRPR